MLVAVVRVNLCGLLDVRAFDIAWLTGGRGVVASFGRGIASAGGWGICLLLVALGMLAVGGFLSFASTYIASVMSM